MLLLFDGVWLIVRNSLLEFVDFRQSSVDAIDDWKCTHVNPEAEIEEMQTVKDILV